EPAVLADALRAEAVADARRLHDRGGAPHVVHEVDETVIEAGNFPPDPLLRVGSGEPPIRFVPFTFAGHSYASLRSWAACSETSWRRRWRTCPGAALTAARDYRRRFPVASVFPYLTMGTEARGIGFGAVPSRGSTQSSLTRLAALG